MLDPHSCIQFSYCIQKDNKSPIFLSSRSQGQLKPLPHNRPRHRDTVDKSPFHHINISSFQFTFHTCFWTGRSWRTKREATKTQDEHASSTLNGVESNPQTYCYKAMCFNPHIAMKLLEGLEKCYSQAITVLQKILDYHIINQTKQQ